jgi:hypothetical protein
VAAAGCTAAGAGRAFGGAVGGRDGGNNGLKHWSEAIRPYPLTLGNIGKIGL